MSKYLIRLTPMGHFFFGGERSFPIGDDDKSEFASYIVESNLFPQQTSLLGMLRFWLLRNDPDAFCINKNKIADNDKAGVLIGPKGFYIESEGEPFGKINSIGYCFLQQKKKDGNITNILPAPLDYNLTVDFTQTSLAFYNNKEKRIPYISYNDNEKQYTDKKGLIGGYINNLNEHLEEEGIFIRDQRIGINRDITTGKTNDGDLYKQIYYRLSEGFCFAFFADFDNELTLPDSGQIVELGGDSSKFILEYTSINENEKLSEEPRYTITPVSEGFSKITLLSDAKIDNTVVEDNTVFAISNHVSFQFLSFETNSNTEYIRKANDKKKNKRFSLFRRGSVFYFNNENKLALFKENLANKAMQQIGYNRF